jgi:hypothetical protein
MLRRVFRNLLGLLLTAMMLAASVIPPGYRHAHEEGGDLRHGHSSDFNLAHSGTAGNACQENGHPSHAPDLFNGCTVENSPAYDKAHRHFQIFGVSVTLPDTHRSSEKSGDDSPKNQIVSIRTTKDILPAGQSEKVLGNWSVFISLNYSPHTAILPSSISHSLQSATSALLCDRARHERSGVQLI